jgi:hypothetical protein
MAPQSGKHERIIDTSVDRASRAQCPDQKERGAPALDNKQQPASLPKKNCVILRHNSLRNVKKIHAKTSCFSYAHKDVVLAIHCMAEQGQLAQEYSL